MTKKPKTGGAGYLTRTDPNGKTPLKTSKIKRAVFNNAPDYAKNLESAGIQSAKKRYQTRPVVGQKHRITDGQYKGEMCKVHRYVNEATFCEIELCDAWGQPNGKRDLVPVRFLSWISQVGKNET